MTHSSVLAAALPWLLVLGACASDDGAPGNPGSGAASGVTGTLGDTTASGSTVSGSTDVGSTTTTGTGGATAGAVSVGGSATTAGEAVTTSAATTGGNEVSSGGASTSGGNTAAGGADAGAGGVSSGSGGTAGSGGVVSDTCPYTPPELPDSFPENWSSDEVIVFNDDAAWTWYSDERVVVDAPNDKLVVSSIANNGGRASDADVVIYDVMSGESDRFVLGNLNDPDDHNVGAVLVQAPGEYLAVWAGHSTNCNSYWRRYRDGQWGEQGIFNWGQHSPPCPWGEDDWRPPAVTYNNVWNMSAEGKIYNFTRTVDTSPNFLVSADDGQSWQYGGRLTSTPRVGYVAGYYKYWGNGVDRIDFIGTEAHPRNNDNSLYHGYVQGGAVYDSFGNVVDDDINDADARDITEYTPIFVAGSELDGLTLNFLWNIDLVRYADGTVAALYKARVDGVLGESNPDHRMLYSRFDGSEWHANYLGRAGPKLFSSEQDYVGLAAFDPDDPHVIYMSTPIDPRDDSTNLDQHEIWKGVTCDDGATFTWTPITMNSSVKNLRPVVPKWDVENTALLWFRGSYSSAQNYDAEVVGILTHE